MADPFVQRMMARTQARRTALSSSIDNKENLSNKKSFSPTKISVTLNTEEVKSGSKKESAFCKDESSPLKSLTSNNMDKPTNDSENNDISSRSTISSIEKNYTSRNRFHLLASRSQQIGEWEDDYTYHFQTSKKSDKVNSPLKKYDKVLESNSSSACHSDCSPKQLNKTKSEKKIPHKSIDEEKIIEKTGKEYETLCDENESSKLSFHTPIHSNSKLSQVLPSPGFHSNSSTSSLYNSCTNSQVASFRSPSPTRKLQWDRSLLNSLEAQGFTPTESRSKLFYDFEKSSEKPQPTTNLTSKSPLKNFSATKVSSEAPKVISVKSKKLTDACVPQTKDERESCSSHVNNLRNQWESQIRNASPERCSPARTPSPVRRQPVSASTLYNRSPSPSKKYHFGSSTTIGQAPPTSGSQLKTTNTSEMPKRTSSSNVVKGEAPMPDTTPVVQNPKASVKERAAAFASIMGNASPEPKVDPAEMSVRDRMSLFEKRKGSALIPKVPFSQSVPQSAQNAPLATKNLVLERGKMPITTPWNRSPPKQCPFVQPSIPKQIKAVPKLEEFSESDYPESEESYELNPSQGPPKPPRVFLEAPSLNYPTVSIASLSPRSLQSISPPKMNSTEIDECHLSPKRASPKKEFVPRIKPGCLFPSLTDIESHSEAADSQDEKDVKNSSFMESVLTCSSFESLGKQIKNLAQKNQSGQLNELSYHSNSEKIIEESLSESTIDALQAVDEALDEAMDDTDEGPTPPKRTRQDDEEDIRYTPVQKIIRYPEICIPSNESPASPSITIGAQIRRLQEEEERQLTLISQASGAMNVVDNRPEDYGTMHHVEAEKLLLIASQKRHMLLNEIQRLKTEGALGHRNKWDEDLDSSRGFIRINQMTLPLKKDFLDKNMNGDVHHHLIVLVKHRDQVIASEVLDTPKSVREGAITFQNPMALDDLLANFNIALEVYSFRIESPSLVNFKKKQSRLKLTPLKKLHKDSRIMSPSVQQSPGGPMAVRSTSFSLIGFTHLNINTLTRNALSLEKVPYHSPLDGHLLMKVECKMKGGVTIKSFLTMFEDVGGFGSWNRRWCVLKGHFLRYWRYPDDENIKESIGFVDLRSCTNRMVELVSRDLCARQHTFQLCLIRPALSTDKPNLIQELKSNALVTKILLSADSKEERIIWCKKLTKALANIRAWDPDALRPEDYSV